MNKVNYSPKIKLKIVGIPGSTDSPEANAAARRRLFDFERVAHAVNNTPEDFLSNFISDLYGESGVAVRNLLWEYIELRYDRSCKSTFLHWAIKHDFVLTIAEYLKVKYYHVETLERLKEGEIRLNDPEDLDEILETTSSCDRSIEDLYNKYVKDAKSLDIEPQPFLEAMDTLMEDICLIVERREACLSDHAPYLSQDEPLLELLKRTLRYNTRDTMIHERVSYHTDAERDRETMGKEIMLKPCPYCGGGAVRLKPTRSENFYIHRVQCRQCGASTDAVCYATNMTQLERARAISKVWNRREIKKSPSGPLFNSQEGGQDGTH